MPGKAARKASREQAAAGAVPRRRAPAGPTPGRADPRGPPGTASYPAPRPASPGETGAAAGGPCHRAVRASGCRRLRPASAGRAASSAAAGTRPPLGAVAAGAAPPNSTKTPRMRCVILRRQPKTHRNNSRPSPG